MKTTALFVELVIIGVGAVSALFLLLLSFFPYMYQMIVGASPLLIIHALAIIYLVGILTDRVSDYLMNYYIKRVETIIDSTSEDKRNILFAANGFFKEMWMYSKSRIRIVRGWILNSLLLMISSVY